MDSGRKESGAQSHLRQEWRRVRLPRETVGSAIRHLNPVYEVNPLALLLVSLQGIRYSPSDDCLPRLVHVTFATLWPHGDTDTLLI